MPEPGAARVAVVIPAYQAASTIAAVIRGLPGFVETIVVVDDGSTDGTAEAAAGTRDPRVAVVRRPRNGGVGAAMATGYAAALESSAEIIVKLDADGQMDPEEMGRLIEPVASGRADYAKGNRFHASTHLRGMPGLRLFGNAGLSFLSKVSSGAWHVFDPCNGYTAIHRAALEALDMRRLHPGYFFESSMLVVLGVLRAVVEDVPIPARYAGEASHLRIGRVLLGFPGLHAAYAAWRFVKQYVVHDFTAVTVLVLAGVPLLAFGFVDGMIVWILSMVTGEFAATGTIVLPLLATILGFQMLLTALQLDIGNAPRRPIQERWRSRRRPAHAAAGDAR